MTDDYRAVIATDGAVPYLLQRLDLLQVRYDRACAVRDPVEADQAEIIMWGVSRLIRDLCLPPDRL